MLNLLGLALTLLTLALAGITLAAPSDAAGVGMAMLTAMAQIAAIACFLRGSR